jgi:hypothetical protein
MVKLLSGYAAVSLDLVSARGEVIGSLASIRAARAPPQNEVSTRGGAGFSRWLSFRLHEHFSKFAIMALMRH